jgi:hypothetical protein
MGGGGSRVSRHGMGAIAPGVIARASLERVRAVVV